MQQNDMLGPSQQQPPSAPRARYRYRSLFWAIVLIGAGAVWLLYNLDVIDPANISVLAYVWPILVIGIGVDLLVGRRSPLAGALVGVVTVGLIIILMLGGPGFGWADEPDLQTQIFSTPAEGVTSADVSIDTGSYSATVSALPSSVAADRPLFKANVTYRGSIHCESSGDVEKVVVLEAKGGSWWWQILGDHESARWEVGLDPDVPLRLKFGSASGSNQLDLSELTLRDLEVDLSSGSVELTLPSEAGQDYDVSLEVSSGDLEVDAPGGAYIDMGLDMSAGDVGVVLGNDSDVMVRFEGSSGQFILDVAAGQALRVEVRDVSSGDVSLPSGLVEVERGDDEEGIWETAGYSSASHKVLLVIESMSSGDVEVRFGG